MMAKLNIASVGIIGCGWLGKALARALIQQQVPVVATTTREEKLTPIAELGCQAELLDVNNKKQAIINSKVFAQQTIVIAIPPRMKTGSSEYPDHIARIVNAANNGQCQRLILLSSTGVYQGLTGQIDETTSLDLQQNKPALLNAAEQKLAEFIGSGYILRLAGLVGPQRHPGRFLAGKTGLTNGDERVHLVHQTDVVGAIVKLLTEPLTAQRSIYNLISETAHSRAYFYHQAAIALGLTPPEFIASAHAPQDKVISSQKSRQQLGYQYQFDDLTAWL